MKIKFYILLAILGPTLSTYKTFAQGCVAVRQMGGNMVCSSSSYNLKKGEFAIGTTYRYFHSWRHFVGTDEKEFRQTTQGGFDTNGNEKGNAVNIYSHAIDINFSYAISDRFQVNLVIPYVHNERSQVLKIETGGKVEIDGKMVDQVLVGQRYSVFAQGLGDIRVNGNYWVFDPATSQKGNLMVGAGLKLNSGSHTVKDDALIVKDPETKELGKESQVMDQAIQPGDGGIGFSIELQGFRQLYKGIYGFANGYYLFNPKESNGTFKSAAKPGLEGYNLYACPDQYFARVGAMTSFLQDKKLTVSGAYRIEGIPAYDVLGGQVAYRRPGLVMAVEPGVSYRMGKHSFSLLVPYNFYKNRVQSAADIAEQDIKNEGVTDPAQKVHIQGDAAFADYSINFNYTFRLGKL